MKFSFNRQHYRFALLLFCNSLFLQFSSAQKEVFIVPNMDKSDTFKTMEPAARRWFDLNRKSDDKEDQNKYISCKKSESGSSVIVVYQRTWINRAGAGGAAKPEKVTDDPTEESTNILIEEIEDEVKIGEKPIAVAGTNPSATRRPVVTETSTLFPSGKTGTRSFRSVKHKSGLITIIETGTNERVVEVKADLSANYLNKGTDVTDAGRRFITTLGKKEDDAGHVIANRLGGSGAANMDNLFPQLPNINRGAFAQWEAQIAALVEDKKNQVSIDLNFSYDPKSSRATGIDYHVTVNGIVKTQTFSN